jgi:hypothetical protein
METNKNKGEEGGNTQWRSFTYTVGMLMLLESCFKREIPTLAWIDLGRIQGALDRVQIMSNS